MVASAGRAHRVLDAPGERRLARQQGRLLPLHAAVQDLDSIHLKEYRRLELAPRQVPHRALADVVYLRELPATAGTLELAVSPFASRPQLQGLGSLVNLVTTDPVAQPAQYPGELVVGRQPTSLSEPTPRNRDLSTDSCTEPLLDCPTQPGIPDRSRRSVCHRDAAKSIGGRGRFRDRDPRVNGG